LLPQRGQAFPEPRADRFERAHVGTTFAFGTSAQTFKRARLLLLRHRRDE
jgi:hypothetical protein